ncbi:WD domain, G-beta repeat [Novymonas esmeraldas]|uniref:WD domain, G-beta repeat n=1 Tax=Novymonas esmeraldas TaxID=1808958 RepID=A0AAW0F1A0_9TRYP
MASGSPHRGRGLAGGGGYASASTSSFSPPSSPHAPSAQSLSRHAQRARHVTPLFRSVASAAAAMSHTSGTGFSTAASPSSADLLRPPTLADGMASRAGRTTSPWQSTSSWLPTRLTSPYCVLSAAGFQEDFYTSCLSWGTNQMALALQEDLVLFHPSHPRQASSTAHISVAPPSAAASSATFPGARRATAVAVMRVQDTSCFLGLSNGAVELYDSRGDGTLQCTVSFAMPPPPTGYLSALMPDADDSGAAAVPGSVSRAARALSLLSSSVSSISCVGTSSRHPWLGCAATAARGLVTLDARQTQPVIRFGSDAELNQDEPVTGATSPVAASSSLASPPAGGGGGGSSGGGSLHKLQRAAAFLRQHDRLCSVAWNASGSLVATGSGSGVVKVWSLSAPQRPLHSFLVDPDCSVKALCFHPCSPYVLLVGASAGATGLRTYDLSGGDPILTSAGATAAPVTQALFDPEGHYAVTGAGVPVSAASPSVSPLSSHAPAAVHGELGHIAVTAGGGGGFLDHGAGWRRSSPSHPSGTSSSSVVGASGGATALHESWDDVDMMSASPLSVTLDATGGLASTGLGGSSGSSAAAHSAPPNALVVWRCGTRRRESYLREALLQRDAQRGSRDDTTRRGDVAGDDEGDCGDYAQADNSSDDGSGDGAWAGGQSRGARESLAGAGGHGHASHSSSGGGGGGTPRSAWMQMYALPGHCARPLLICAPFPQSPFAGCCASVAGGDDGTIRFWRLFEATSDATHWQHRRHAQQQSATTLEDMDLLSTPVLR